VVRITGLIGSAGRFFADSAGRAAVEDRRAGPGATGPTLVRVDGLLTGVVFERDLDAVLAFRTGPLRNPTCRWQDYQDVRTMLR
jgi:hypothetical protein